MQALRRRFNSFTNRHPLLTMLATMILLVLAWSMLPDDPPTIDAPRVALTRGSV
jgi:predicted tellurium resistance membrane protein TerC